MSAIPDLLTVEEAAEHLRIGRTKAYAMAKEYRASGGRSGLPVVDLGHVLRVRRSALEQLIGGELTGSQTAALPRRTRGDVRGPAETTTQPPASVGHSSPASEECEPPRLRRVRRSRAAINQLDLFGAGEEAS